MTNCDGVIKEGKNVAFDLGFDKTIGPDGFAMFFIEALRKTTKEIFQSPWMSLCAGVLDSLET